jgi:ABC-2 type transport system permease protein
MLGSVFLRALQDQKRPLAWWAAGWAFLALTSALLFPSVSGMPELTQMLENDAPPLIKALLGELSNLQSPTGYLNARIFILMGPLLFIIFGVLAGSGAVAGEEERGTLDLLLSTPLSRTRLVLNKLASMLVGFAALGFVLWASLAVGASIVGMEIGLLELASAILANILLALVFSTLALVLGCATGKRGNSGGIAAGVAVLLYFVNTFGQLVNWLEPLRVITPFYHATIPDALTEGLSWQNALLPFAVSALLVLAALLLFNRRDIA